MGSRDVRYVLEAKLRPSGQFSTNPNGRVVRKSYSDGGERLKIVVRKIAAPDNTLVIVKLDDDVLAQLPLENGFARYDEESFEAEVIPGLRAGQKVEVLANNVLFLEAELKEI